MGKGQKFTPSSLRSPLGRGSPSSRRFRKPENAERCVPFASKSHTLCVPPLYRQTLRPGLNFPARILNGRNPKVGLSLLQVTCTKKRMTSALDDKFFRRRSIDFTWKGWRVSDHCEFTLHSKSLRQNDLHHTSPLTIHRNSECLARTWTFLEPSLYSVIRATLAQAADFARRTGRACAPYTRSPFSEI